MTQLDLNLAEALVNFGGSAPPVDAPDKAILGGKGLGLQEMGRIGVDVPPGFTLVTKLCQVYQKADDLPKEMWDMVRAAIERVEKDTGKKFGSEENPLLFSCRSGAAISMPGMMDTVLNIVSKLGYFGQKMIRVLNQIILSLFIGSQRHYRRSVGKGHRQPSICLRRLPSSLGHAWRCRSRYPP